MKSFWAPLILLLSCLSTNAQAAGVCSRSTEIVKSLEYWTTKSCEFITPHDLANFRVFTVSGEGINKLKEGDFEGLNLDKLNLSSNYLDENSFSAGAFKGLKTKLIDLSSNEFKEVPSNLFDKISALETINLRGNKIIRIDSKAFQGHPEIRVLYLDHNYVEELPADLFQNLDNLEELHLYNNQIKTLPVGLLKQNPNLWRVEISNNQLTELNAGIFHPRLSALTINGNFIKKIDPGAFEDIALSYIDLSNNRLNTLPENLFHGKEYLQFIGLSGNNLSDLHKNTFEGCASIERLEIRQGNQLTDLDLQLLVDLFGEAHIF